MPEDKRFDFEVRMLEKGAEEIQKIIARLDDLLFKVNASAITVWVALVGWSLTIKSKNLLIVAIPVLFGFWAIAATFRAIQVRYVDKSRSMASFLSDHSKVEECFNRKEVPSGLVFSLGGEEGIIEKAELLWKGILSPTVAVFYGFFVVIDVILWTFLEM